MTLSAEIEYRNAPTEPVNITLHLMTLRHLDGGLCVVDTHDMRHGIKSKAEALAIVDQLGAVLS